MIIVVTGCIGNKEDMTTKTPISSSENMTEKYSLGQLVSMSDTIIIGYVLYMSSKWNTSDGKKHRDDDIIYTDIDILTEEYLKNPSGTEIITVRVLGGTVGQDKLEVEDQPSFNKTEKVLIFLKEDTDPRTKYIKGKHFVVTGLIQGKISILGDNKVTLDEIRNMTKDAK